MIFAASLLITTAAAAAPGMVHGTSHAPVSRSPIAVQTVATARILAGVQMRFDDGRLLAETPGKVEPLIHRDISGTLWAEFS